MIARQRLTVALLLLLALVLLWRSPLLPPKPTDNGVSGSISDFTKDLRATAQHRQCPSLRDGNIPPIAFMHIPKTAGTAVRESLRLMLPQNGTGRWCKRGKKQVLDADLPAIYGQCGHEQTGWADPDPEHLELLEATKRSFPYHCAGFSNHHDMTFFELADIDFTRALTVVALRHPVERQISDYYFSMRIRPVFMDDLNYAPKHKDDYSGLLKYVREVGCQHQVRQLAGAFGCRWPGGPTVQPEGQAMLDAAKRNLERFCVIVISEWMHESRVRIAEAAGWDINDYRQVASKLEQGAKSGKVNGNPHPDVPSEVRKEIEVESLLDMQIYEHALKLFLYKELIQ